MQPGTNPQWLRELEREITAHPGLDWLRMWGLRLRILAVHDRRVVARLDIWRDTVKPTRQHPFMRTPDALAREVAPFIQAFTPFAAWWTIGVLLRPELPPMHDLEDGIEQFIMAYHHANVELLCRLYHIDPAGPGILTTIVEGGVE